MARTDNLRRQHDAAVGLVTDIDAALDRGRPSETEAFALGLKLAKLTGLLRIHFAQEDKTLYPYMQRSTHREASATATAFEQEMGGISAAFMDFADRWNGPARIAADFPTFRRECTAVFAALADRVHRENSVLYPLADAIRPHETRDIA